MRIQTLATAPLALVSGSGPMRGLANSALKTYARNRIDQIARSQPADTQQQLLRGLVHKAKRTRFGIDHGFEKIRTIADFQAAVPLRTYEKLWKDYLEIDYPVFQDLTWPGRIPYLALTSGTTQGATKYIPISREMLASNTKAALTMIAHHISARPTSRLFHGRIFFLGGSTNLERRGPGVEQGDLSGIAAKELNPILRPYTFPPLALALEPDWDRKLDALATTSLDQPITLVGGVPSWLLVLFQKLLRLSGKSLISDVWPTLEVIVHGGVKFDPYQSAFDQIVGPGVRLQETYPCSEGFIAHGDPATNRLRLIYDHGIFYEFVPVDELDSDHPTRHWVGDVQTGISYAIVVSTCAGMWAHIIGDTVRFESLNPPLLTFTGRTKYTLSAFGEHLISEEVEAAVAEAGKSTGCITRDWHAGPVFSGPLGHHVFIFEFLKAPEDLKAFRLELDADLCRRNADYQAHRDGKVGLPKPAIVVARPGGFDAWMRSRGKLGGQHKVPRMDNSGTLTCELQGFLKTHQLIEAELAAG